MFKESDSRALQAAFRELVSVIDRATLRQDAFKEDTFVPEGAGAAALATLIDTGYSAAQIQAVQDSIQDAALKAGGGNISGATVTKLTQLINYIPVLLGT